jgi:hypothetical protein
MEDNRLTLAPIFIEDLDTVFGGDHAHRVRSFASI